MYCQFCGRTLRNNEGCCCCKAVAIRNGEPGFHVTKSFVRNSNGIDFEHGHEGGSYKSDVYGKFDSSAYDVNKYYNLSSYRIPEAPVSDRLPCEDHLVSSATTKNYSSAAQYNAQRAKENRAAIYSAMGSNASNSHNTNPSNEGNKGCLSLFIFVIIIMLIRAILSTIIF